MFLADPSSDPKSAEQVLLEVLALLEEAPAPINSDKKEAS